MQENAQIIRNMLILFPVTGTAP